MKTFVGATLSTELAELLRERAERNNRTVAGELREILGEVVKQGGRKGRAATTGSGGSGE